MFALDLFLNHDNMCVFVLFFADNVDIIVGDRIDLIKITVNSKNKYLRNCKEKKILRH